MRTPKKSAVIGEAMDAHVGARIRLRRQAMGISMNRLGELLAIGRQHVEKWEHGTTRLSAGQIFEVSQLLDVDPGWFFKDFPLDGVVSSQQAEELDLLFKIPDGVQVLLAYSHLNKVERISLLVLMTALATSGNRTPTADGLEKTLEVAG